MKAHTWYSLSILSHLHSPGLQEFWPQKDAHWVLEGDAVLVNNKYDSHN